MIPRILLEEGIAESAWEYITFIGSENWVNNSRGFFSELK